MSSSEVMDFSFQLLETITNNFSEQQKLGTGGYGEVYKGVLNGEEIAVKMLFPVNGLDDKEFANEMGNLMMTRHENIVRLIGYCYEVKYINTEYNGQLVLAKVVDRALCFEYMQNGSLAKHISDESCIHNWPTTYKIIKGICEGLHYLHRGRKDYIYHLDLKPDNILLDNNMVPKISDFGLSRLFGSSRTHITSTQRGTVGFMPPEYINNHVITPKNDVFSLGVIIFQIMAGKQGYNNYCESSSPQEFIERVQENWQKSLLATVGYTSDDVDLLVLGVKKCIKIAVTSVETNRDKRPTTMQIIDELNKLEAPTTKISKVVRKPLTQQIIQKYPTGILSIDVHPTKTWILTSHRRGFRGSCHIWDYTTQDIACSFEFVNDRWNTHMPVMFIVQKQWVVVAHDSGYLEVYCYNTRHKVASIKAHDYAITCLDIHSTVPYVLSASSEIKLWNWEKDWECIQTFNIRSEHVKFNPKDADHFICDCYMEIQIWNIGSSRPLLTLKKLGSSVGCFDYFTRFNELYLMIGHWDGTAAIWHLENRARVETLNGHADRISAACSHPDLPLLVTGSVDGRVRLWNSLSFELEGTLDCGLGTVQAISFLKGSRRVVIGHAKGLAVSEF